MLLVFCDDIKGFREFRPAVVEVSLKCEHDSLVISSQAVLGWIEMVAFPVPLFVETVWMAGMQLLRIGRGRRRH